MSGPNQRDNIDEGSRLDLAPFDPYRKWLQIDGRRRPPTHYDLLAVDRQERDPDRIREAFKRRYAEIRKHQTGHRADIASALLDELAIAVSCLTDPSQRETYDRQLDGVPQGTPTKGAAAPIKLDAEVVKWLGAPDKAAVPPAYFPFESDSPVPPQANSKRGLPSSPAPAPAATPPPPQTAAAIPSSSRPPAKRVNHERRSMLPGSRYDDDDLGLAFRLLIVTIMIFVSISLAWYLGSHLAGVLQSPTNNLVELAFRETLAQWIVPFTYWSGVAILAIVVMLVLYDAWNEVVGQDRALSDWPMLAAWYVLARIGEMDAVFVALLGSVTLSAFGIAMESVFTAVKSS